MSKLSKNRIATEPIESVHRVTFRSTGDIINTTVSIVVYRGFEYHRRVVPSHGVGVDLIVVVFVLTLARCSTGFIIQVMLVVVQALF